MKLLRLVVVLLLCFYFPYHSTAQITFNANTKPTAFTHPFGFGMNFGIYSGWSDEDLAALTAGDANKNIDGLKGNSIRPTLPGFFLEDWGYDIRKNAFQYYKSIGLEGIVAFVGYPPESQKELAFHCETTQSEMYANMYTPIWDDGENGTPVNDTNYYALYLYNTILTYGDYVDIWEISNEPDLTWSTSSYEGPEVLTSWWNRDPTPCELAIKAPIQHYIRMLRISYEVIKYMSPEDYVAVGGIGYPSFLDGILRNTDSPDGTITSEFPYRGGAYFDVLSFHTYPHIDGSMRAWSDAIQGFVYSRHSDQAIQGFLTAHQAHKNVLHQHGYNGSHFPKKHFIVTETNIPRKEFGEYIGSNESQRNYTSKVLLKAMQHDIHQIHFYTISEQEDYHNSSNEFSLMGMYEDISGQTPEQVVFTEQGTAFKTTAKLLKGYQYDADRTEALELPLETDGIALKNQANEYIYALWAKTTKDNDETATQFYSFPLGLNDHVMEVYHWDYAKTNDIDSIPGACLELSASPRFFKPIGNVKLAFKIEPRIGPNPATDMVHVNFCLFDEADVQIQLFDMQGRMIVEVLPKSQFLPGTYSQSLSVEDMPFGVYFLKIQARQQSLIEKIYVGRTD